MCVCLYRLFPHKRADSCFFLTAEPKVQTECGGEVAITPTSYLGGPEFKTRPGHRLPVLWFPWFH